VTCQPEGAGRTRVRVGYEMRALSPEGRAYISELSDDAFADMIDEWTQLIDRMASPA